MRQRKGKPSKWEWGLAAGSLLAGLLLLLPSAPALLREKLPSVLIPVGLILLLLYGLQYALYRTLPQADQRERDRADRDERSEMIQGKAAVIQLDLETALLIILLILFGLYFEDRTVVNLLLWVNVFRLLTIQAIRWWLNRKY